MEQTTELIENDEIIFEARGRFTKTYNKSWEYLWEKFTPLEFKAAYALVRIASGRSNSLAPIGDETSYQELSVILGVGKNRVDKTLKKLFEYGVYARFEVEDKTKPYTKFWVLNPHLAFSGSLIKSDVVDLFKGTVIGLHYRGMLY